jgi:hypothetical protein
MRYKCIAPRHDVTTAKMFGLYVTVTAFMAAVCSRIIITMLLIKP